MRTILNVIWVIFGGFWLFLGYFLAGVIACVLIITIPIGVASFCIAGYALWPFGREVVPTRGAGVMTGLANVVWFLVAGLWLALGHLNYRGPAGDHDYRHPPGRRQYQDDPGDLLPLRQAGGQHPLALTAEALPAQGRARCAELLDTPANTRAGPPRGTGTGGPTWRDRADGPAHARIRWCGTRSASWPGRSWRCPALPPVLARGALLCGQPRLPQRAGRVMAQ